ncbi:MAG: hypothetical protein WAU75_14990, partial [Solirubrobacteraceae bacterium]
MSSVKAAPRTDHSDSPPVWRAFYEDADRRSASLRRALGTRVELDVSYGDDPRHLLDVYLPPPNKRTGAVFVFFHGGALVGGHPRHYGYLAAAFLERGAIFIAPGYRLLHPAAAAERDRLEH